MFFLKFQMYRLLIYLSATPTPTPDDKKYNYINSATSNVSVGEKDYGLIGEYLEDGLAWISDKLIDLLEPFLDWGSRIIIVSCIIIYFCSNEKKYLSVAMKWGIIFIVFCLIRSAVG